jgi:uncharacterized membrane protein YfcA
LAIDTRLAVAAVSIPHVVGTAIRFVSLRASIDRKLLWTFGLTSAGGGLLGALLQADVSDRALTLVFGLLLLLTATAELSGVSKTLRFRGTGGWIAGAASGFLGGLVGNQGGVRSAALLGFDLSKASFVATATAIALLVDGTRVPVYVATHGPELAGLARWIGLGTVGVVAGTLLGGKILMRVPEHRFRGVVAVTIAVLGTAMLAQAAAM